MKRYSILLVIPLLLACGLVNTPLPSTPTPDSGLPTFAPSTTVPNSPAPTDALPTELPPNASTFPDANAYQWQLIASGLDRPVDLQADGSGRLFVIEKLGHIHIIENGQLIENPFLNITDRVDNSSNEMGLLGLAFHSNYAQNGYFFVNYTGSGGDTFVSRFQVSGDMYIANPSSEVILLRIEQPFPNHNGGGLAFFDNHLYIGVGDGGAAGDPFGNAQNLNTMLGKILKIEPLGGEGASYEPALDNPFLGSDVGLNEIWDYGLRNPWRISFDMFTGDLYIGDVGQGTWEEINIHPAGSPGGINYGWKFREGAHEYDGNAPAGLTDPIAEYSHSEGGCSVTGGYVYRGSMPEWNGIYLYGDYCTGYVWGTINVDGQWQAQLLFETGERITSFGQDSEGEVYLVSDVGNVYQLVRK